ncbi:unnamed protein product [Citrullus colocynthis]|uniref:Uncharacterized protein n=1 Tax=Citrullus colocynthis TaxID=252529 RepID=A0ABP0YLA3_9ROSI
MILHEFSEHDDLDADQLETLATFNRLIQGSHDYFLEDSFYSQHHINEDEDILFRFTELSVVSDTETNTELNDCSTPVDKESYGGSEHNIEEGNQEHLLEDALHSPHAIKEDEEDIPLRLAEVSVLSDPELETEQDDHLPQVLDARRTAAEKDSRGGFKHKIGKENQAYVLQDPTYLQNDIKEEEDILRWLESEGEFTTEQKKEDEDLRRRLNESVMKLAYKESDGGFKQRMEEAIQKKVHEKASHSPDNIKGAEDPLIQFMESILAAVKAGENKEQKDLHRDSKCHRRVPDNGTDRGCKHRIEEKKQKYLNKDALCFPYCINEDEDLIVQFLVSVLEAVNAGKKEQKDVHGDLKGGLKQKMTTEKVDNPFDLDSLQDLEEIVLKLYEFIDHIIPMLKDAQKVRLELEDKLKFLQKVNDLLLTSSKIVNKLMNELERMKNDEKNHGKTQDIPEILIQLVELNAHLVERWFPHAIGFMVNNKCAKNELADCVKALNRSREDFGDYPDQNQGTDRRQQEKWF